MAGGNAIFFTDGEHCLRLDPQPDGRLAIRIELPRSNAFISCVLRADTEDAIISFLLVRGDERRRAEREAASEPAP